MVSSRCKMAVKEELKKLDLHFIILNLGEVEIMEDLSSEKKVLLKAALLKAGFELMDDKRSVLIEKIKNVILEMVHQSEEPIKIKFSDFFHDSFHDSSHDFFLDFFRFQNIYLHYLVQVRISILILIQDISEYNL